jgi:hypothetical protein
MGRAQEGAEQVKEHILTDRCERCREVMDFLLLAIERLLQERNAK